MACTVIPAWLRRRCAVPRYSRVSLLVLLGMCAFLANVKAQDADGRGVPSAGPDDGVRALDSLLSIRISAATKTWELTRDVPASATVITSFDIERYGYRTLADALASVRGFYITNDRNYLYAGVRGFSRPTDYNNRLLLLLNDHPVQEPFYGTMPLAEFTLDPLLIDRIEIVRGPASALFGSGAMLAVVNVVTKGGGDLDGIAVTAEGGSFGAASASITAGTECRNAAEGILSVRFARSDGPDLFFPEFVVSTSDGWARQRDWERTLGAFAAVRVGNTSLQAFTGVREKGIPTASFDTRFNDARTRTRDLYASVALRHDMPRLPTFALTARVFADAYAYDGVYPLDTPVDLLTEDMNRSILVGAELRGIWDPVSDLRVTTGLEARRVFSARYRNWTEFGTLFETDLPSSMLSGYGQAEYQPWWNVILTGGLRLDATSISRPVLAPRVGMVVALDDATTLKALYGESFRAPNVYEREFEDRIFGFTAGRDHLVPERLQTTELALERRVLGILQVGASLYRTRMSDLIEQDSSRFANIGGVLAHGAECEAVAVFSRDVRGYASYGIQRTDTSPGGTRLSNSPEHLLKAGLMATPLHGLDCSLEALHVSSRLTLNAGRLPSFVLLHFGVTCTPDLFGIGSPVVEGMRLRLAVRNLLDRRHDAPAGYEHLQTAIAQPGRTVTATLQWRMR